MKPFLDFSNKVALVTGGSSGIGAATAKLLAALGAKVVIGFGKNRDGAEKIRAEIEKEGGKFLAIQADVRISREVRRVVQETVDAFGPIDVLVNNAGSMVERVSLLEISEERWDEVMDVNLTSAMICTQAVAQSMIDRKTGAIVNIVSIAGRNGGGPGAGAYSTSKGALITLTKAWAKELAPRGVRVNAVAPGVIETPFHETFSTPEMISNFVKTIPLGRVGASAECANVIAFLASDAASYVIGETIEVNGGQLML